MSGFTADLCIINESVVDTLGLVDVPSGKACMGRLQEDWGLNLEKGGKIRS